ncbi:MAG: AzlC family ABC transporter permease [Eubacterium sp.]|nr:AzlC family ABC transporter permease [Eubacterium sp.]
MIEEFKRGAKDGIPIALGYFAVSFTFGIAGSVDGLYWWQVVLISMTNLTSAGQFAGLEVMAAAGSLIELALTQLVINLRYSLMALSLTQNLDKKFKGIYRWLYGFAITDEIFAVAATNEKPVRRSYFGGLMVLPYFGWMFGTLFGVVLGNVLPAVVVSSLGIAIYGMFVAIVVPDAKKDRNILIVVIVAMAISCILKFTPVFAHISSGFAIIICAVAASALGALVFPMSYEEADS